MDKFILGNRIKDAVTGFTGIAVARIEYINGCVQYGIKPNVDKDGKMQEVHYIDQEQLRFVDDGIVVLKGDTGGDMEDCPKN